MTLEGCLSTEVLEIVVRLAKVSKILAKACDKTIECSEAEFFTAYKPEHEFHTCIECLRSISPASSESRGTSIEHVVCLALVTFCNCVFGCMTYGPLFKAVQESLTKAIADLTVQQGHHDFVVWAASISLWAESVNSGVRCEKTMEMMETIRDARCEGLEYDEYQHILRGFLWTEDMVTVCQRNWQGASCR